MIPKYNDRRLYELAKKCQKDFGEISQSLAKDINKDQEAMPIWVEFQHRFASFASYSIVFARKSRCLDSQLCGYPDLQYLIADLLHTLNNDI